MDKKEINALFKEIAEYKLLEAEAKAEAERKKAEKEAKESVTAPDAAEVMEPDSEEKNPEESDS